MNKKIGDVVVPGPSTVHWVDHRKSELAASGLDERVLLRVYRVCKRHYEFILGFVICLVIVVVIVK